MRREYDFSKGKRGPVLKAAPGKGGAFTVDGVHMNPQGNCLMATGVLRAFGLAEPQILKAREGWMAIPDAVTLHGQRGVSMGEFEQLKVLADREKRSVDEMVDAAFAAAVSDLLKAAQAQGPGR